MDPAWPTGGWRLLAETGTGALYGVLAPEGAESPAYVVTIRETGDGWQAEDQGGCTPKVLLDPGVGGASWLPAGEVDDSETELEVLVTETACASGESSEGRVVEPRILVDDDAITITFGVTPLDGAQDCQGNPASSYVVTLPEPLGDRDLRDGGVYPPVTVAQ